MAPIFSKNKCKCMLLSKFLPVLYLSIMFSLSGCLKSSNTGSSSNNSSAQSSSTKGPKGDAGPAGPQGPMGPAGGPLFYLYDANNIKIGSRIISLLNESSFIVWDDDLKATASYRVKIFGATDSDSQKLFIQDTTIFYSNSDCTGTAYISANWGSNTIIRSLDNILYKTTTRTDIITPLSYRPFPDRCSTDSGGNPPVKWVILEQYTGGLPISAEMPLRVSTE